jgi:hypothetical protein
MLSTILLGSIFGNQWKRPWVLHEAARIVSTTLHTGARVIGLFKRWESASSHTSKTGNGTRKPICIFTYVDVFTYEPYVRTTFMCGLE